ncbi:FAD binding domain-containing protein [Gracilinema caldarium]|uniref:Carbon-monoxide dehydrogenase (Acceptor) n=1 Tax=Gracilinema caldarium (strain ATCC 51460 / DSM 7334 / H1) TaxID=744872 RepID=F8F1C6_GRAC1|nr:FAD binding domain-containing protein [Gracilinema caldarium]AEJ18770.1 Carbon-monoxide dehydrogenase (acceptor) [Gracilinema caldarium DSM 7334]
MLHQFTYAAPRSTSEPLSILDDQAEKAKILAGGTDLLVNIHNRVMKPQLVVDIKKVAGYEGISYSPTEGLIFRPTVTINDILRDPSVRDHYPLLQDCGHDLASYQVRNRAPIMGNVVNASPCSDMAPALLCLGAQARIASSKGTREVPFKEFFTGVKKTVLSPTEVLEAIVIPAASAGGRGAYRKLKRINGHDLGIIGVAVYIKGDVLRIAVSSAAPTPVVTLDLPASIPIEDAVVAARNIINPISDVRCSKEYREFMVEVFVKRLLQEIRK